MSEEEQKPDLGYQFESLIPNEQVTEGPYRPNQDPPLITFEDIPTLEGLLAYEGEETKRLDETREGANHPVPKAELTETPEQLMKRMYDKAQGILQDAGFTPEELSNSGPNYSKTYPLMEGHTQAELRLGVRKPSAEQLNAKWLPNITSIVLEEKREEPEGDFPDQTQRLEITSTGEGRFVSTKFPSIETSNGEQQGSRTTSEISRNRHNNLHAMFTEGTQFLNRVSQIAKHLPKI